MFFSAIVFRMFVRTGYLCICTDTEWPARTTVFPFRYWAALVL